jgi:uncharacterized phage infection (PIP) family protein YhgE
MVSEEIRKKMIESCDYAIHELNLIDSSKETERGLKTINRRINELKNGKAEIRNMNKEELNKFEEILRFDELRSSDYVRKLFYR